MNNHIASLSRRFHQKIFNMWTSDIHLVTHEANWVLSWVTHYVSDYLQNQRNLPVHLTDNALELKNQIIHFINRYAYLNGAYRKIHPSNHVILTWFHGDPKDPRPEQQRLFNNLLEAAQHIEKIVVSCRISQQSLIKLGVPVAQLVTIPLGVDLIKFGPSTVETRLGIRTRLGIPMDAICIGSFQKDGEGWDDGLVPKLIKGPDVFLEFASALSKQYNNIVVLLTGPARGYVKQGLEQLGVPYIHCYVSDYHDIVQFYHALDLYVIASRVEGGPAALLESWATGVPIVSTRVGMPADLIVHGQNGMLAEIEDVAGLVNGAAALIENDTLREKCRSQALTTAQQYAWPLVAEEYYQKLYQHYLK